MAWRNNKDSNPLWGRPEVLEEHTFCQEAEQKDLGKIHANDAKMVSTYAEAIQTLVEPKPVNQLAFAWEVDSWLYDKGWKFCPPRPEAQSKAETAAVAQAQVSAPASVQSAKDPQACVKAHRKGFSLSA